MQVNELLFINLMCTLIFCLDAKVLRDARYGYNIPTLLYSIVTVMKVRSHANTWSVLCTHLPYTYRYIFYDNY